MNTNTINSKNVISGVNDSATKCPKISAMWSAKNTYPPQRSICRQQQESVVRMPRL